MRKTIFLLVIAIAGLSLPGLTQKGDSSYLVRLNQQIDDYVVQQKVKELESLYADDFVFSHGSGKVEGKAGWLKTVGRTISCVERTTSSRISAALGILPSRFCCAA